MSCQTRELMNKLMEYREKQYDNANYNYKKIFGENITITRFNWRDDPDMKNNDIDVCIECENNKIYINETFRKGDWRDLFIGIGSYCVETFERKSTRMVDKGDADKFIYFTANEITVIDYKQLKCFLTYFLKKYQENINAFIKSDCDVGLIDVEIMDKNGYINNYTFEIRTKQFYKINDGKKESQFNNINLIIDWESLEEIVDLNKYKRECS